MKVESLGEGGNLNSINQQVIKMKKDAEDLLNKAKSGIKQLDSKYMRRHRQAAKAKNL